MVVTLFPATVETGVMQDRVGWPLICTVQAPHRAMPQPNLVPVMPSVSRKAHNKGICGTTSTVCDFPFRVNLTAATGPPWGIRHLVYREGTDGGMVVGYVLADDGSKIYW